MSDLTRLRMDMDDVAEMEAAFLECAHIAVAHPERLADHPWTECFWARDIRKRVDQAWACIPPEYCLVLRDAVAGREPHE